MSLPPEIVRALDDLVRSDLQSLRDTYFHRLILSSVLVAIGVGFEAPELVHETASLFRPKHSPIVDPFTLANPPKLAKRDWIKWTALIGWLLVIAGVVGEGVFEVYVSDADGLIQDFNNIILVSDQRDVLAATKQAGNAAAAADRASVSATRADKLSSSAASTAGKAETLASGARQEADTFEKRIGSAEHKADQAESHLAEALRQNIESQAELNRIKNPRSLDVQKLVLNIKQFAGTPYTFKAVFGDQESLDFLRIIDGAMQSSGWNRVKPDGGFPSLKNLFGDPKIADWEVQVAIHNGVRVFVESPDELKTLLAIPIPQLPDPVKAAVVLNLSLSDSINPPEAENRQPVKSVDVITRKDSKRVLISVGKKP